MKFRINYLIPFILAIGFLFHQTATAQTYTIPNSVVGNGGETMSSGNYSLSGTTLSGPAALGLSSESFNQDAGFWAVYQATADVTAPATPTNLTATPSSGQVVLTWTANSESDLASYKVYGGTNASPTTLLSTITAGTETYTHSSLTNGTTYYYRITAVDNAGNASGYSSEVNTVPYLFDDVSAGLTGISESVVTWGDYDSDGDLDVLMAGATTAGQSGAFAKIYKNTAGVFSDIGASLTGVYHSAAAWGDYDNDGDLDLLLVGETGSGKSSKIYQNTNGVFSDISASLIGVGSGSSVAWGDYDNDGDLDILLIGYLGYGNKTSKIYRNDNGSFTDISHSIPDIAFGSVKWIDYDNDSDLDIFINGVDESDNYISKVYKNTNNSFSEITTTLTGVHGSIDFGDYDNDGDLDILMAGNTDSGGNPVTKIYSNTSGVFSEVAVSLTQTHGTAIWGDYDNDGDLDILMVGKDGFSNAITKLYQNNSGNFAEIPTVFTTVDANSFFAAAWGDYDNDNDLDILITGNTGSSRISKIYRNNITTSNTIPSAPGNLTSSISADTVTISWNASSDNQTAVNGLNYNIRVGTTSKGNETVTAHSDSSTGYRRIVSLGNSQKMKNWTFNNLSDGTYYWSVQVIDNTFAGSAFATEASFTIAIPPEAPTNLIATPGNTQVILTWTANSESDLASYKVYGETSASPTTLLSTISAGTETYTHSSLTNGTTYYYRITAVDNAGNESEYSNEVSAVPALHRYTVKTDGTGDFTSIQAAIDTSTHGDTVLVYPGTYVENINFNGKNIVVGSLFLTTQNTSYISLTIIDGNQNGSVVTFESGEDSTTVLSGFTITGGNANGQFIPDNQGGGIYCNGVNVNLSNLVIKDCFGSYGGGIFSHGLGINNRSNLYIEDVVIENNSSDNFGGGIYLWWTNAHITDIIIRDNQANSGGGICVGYSNPYIVNALIYNNTATTIGGGLHFYTVTHPVIINSTVSNNIAPNGAGISCRDYSNPIIINSIIYDNAQEIYSYASDNSNSVTIFYSNIDDGQNGIVTNNNCTISWGEGNIDQTPLYVNTDNGNYLLSNYSPNIGTGTDSVQINGTWYYAPSTDIDGNIRPNPAGSNPDMGAYENALGSPSVPPVPTNLATTANNGLVHLTWTGNQYSTSYSIYRSNTSGSGYTLVSNVGDTTAYTNAGLTNDITYYYAVTATGAGGESGYSNEVSATPKRQLYTVKTDGTGDYTVIQEAIDASISGDTVLVGDGTYTGVGNKDLTWSGKHIILKSENGSGSCIIDCENSGRGFYFNASGQNSSDLIEGFTIRNGEADYGGGMYLYSTSYLSYMEIRDIIFDSNHSTIFGGGLYSNESHPILRNVTFLNNSSVSGGAAIWQDSQRFELYDSKIIGNTSTGRGVIYGNSGGCILTNVLIADNTITNSVESIIDVTASVILKYVTVVNNSISNYTLYSQGVSPTISNSIFWNENATAELVGATGAATYTAVRGGFSGEGNIGLNPLFLDSVNSDYRLSDYSPCIGAGDTSYTIASDINDNARPNPAGSNPDMGAYENSLPSQRPKAGTIADGLFTDVDWWNSETFLSANWAPFTDDSTITYEYAIGTSTTNLSDILGWTSNGTDTSVTKTGLTLTEGSTYYISVRGTDIHSQVSDTTTSDGITIDTTPPTISEAIEGSSTSNTTVTDIDGNVYQTVQIGDQIWMKENLKVTKYRNGEAIPTGHNNSTWAALTTGAYTVYNDNTGNTDTYGLLYNWYVVNDNRGIAPEGWHIPTDDEWKQLEMYLGMSQSEADRLGGGRGTDEGGKLKRTGTDYWFSPNTGATNESGFAALPGGFRNGDGDYYGKGEDATFWSSTAEASYNAWYRNLYNDNSGIGRSGYDNEGGFSVRCIKDNTIFTGGDADYQNSTDSLIVSWSGSDVSSGITNYEYALGTTTGGTETINWTSTNTATADTIIGLSLIEGTIYYLSVRATDNAGNVSTVLTGDGIALDLTAPSGTIVNDGTTTDITYTGSDTTLSANWPSFTETVSGIAKYEYAIGTTAGGTDIVTWTTNSTDTTFTKTGLTLTNGTTYYISVKATDGAGNVSTTIISDGVIVDTASPVAGMVSDGTTTDIDWINSTTSLSATWSGFSDGLSGIQKYEYAIGTTSGGTEVLTWSDNTTDTTVTKTGLTLTNGTTYYISVRSTDNVGNVSVVSTTDGITIDTTPPTMSSVIEGSASGDTTVTDIDGNVYQTVQIGNQIWMQENLKVTKYHNGDAIPTGYDNSTWITLTSGAYAIYNDDPANADTYGYLYNWYAVDDSRNLAPTGWHIPTDDEWKELEMYLGMSQSEADQFDWRGTDEGGKLKEAGITHWNSPNTGATNESGFTALPGGRRHYLYGNYSYMGSYTYFWSATEYSSLRARDRVLYYTSSDFSRGNGYKRHGFSIRCLSDNTTFTGGDADFQNSTDSLIVSWSGSDAASGITTFEYALGTTSGGTETINWTSTNIATADTIIGLSLIEGPTYYLSVRATDNAGNISAVLTGDGIAIDLTAPSGTTVNDGTTTDIAFTDSDSTLSANWPSFTETVSGIAKYEYAIGTTSGGTDVVTWISNNTDTSFTKTGLSLSNGTTYYLSVKATDGAGNVSTTIISDGVIVDTASPVAGTVLDGTTTDIDWINSTTTLSANWSGFSDVLSGIQNYEYAIGTTSGGTNIVAWTDNNSDTTIIRTDLTLSNGTTYYISIRSTDNVGNVSTVVSSDGITIDTTLPTMSSVIEGSSTNSTTVTDMDGNVYQTVQIGDQIWMIENLKVTHYRNGETIPTGYSNSEWEGLSTGAYAIYNDNESNAETYGYLYNWYAVDDNRSIAPSGWHVPTDDEWKELEMYLGMSQSEADQSSWRGTDEGGKLKEAGTTHWNSLNTGATNESGFTALPSGYRNYYNGNYYYQGSYGYFWSSTEYGSSHAWYRGLYYSSSDVSRIGNYKGSGVSIRCINDNSAYAGGDADYQNDTDTLFVSWSGSDASSGIVNYEYALGTTSGGTETTAWTSIGTATADTIIGLSLIEGTTYYLSVKATDNAGNVSAVLTGDGITIDLTAPSGTTVNDGTGTDITFTGSDTTLSANWQSFTDAVSGIANYEYAIGTTSGGTEVKTWTNNTTDTTFTKTGLTLTNGTSYYISVKASDAAGNVSDIVSSDGVTIDNSPPTNGTVADGSSIDMEWTNVIDSLMTHWQGFSDTLSGIRYYEYALGTTIGGTEIVSWDSVALDTTVISTNLTLNDGLTYYASVRATDNMNNISDLITSDGITIDLVQPIIDHVFEGSFQTDKDYQNQTDTLTLSWFGNDAASGILRYEYTLGISSGDTSERGWTNADTMTFITIPSLSLIEGMSYYASVRAFDVAGNVSTVFSGDGITIDVTPPVAGTVIDGNNTDLVYTGSDSSLTATWSGFSDALSGIEYYEYAIGTAIDGTDVMGWTADTTADFGFRGSSNINKSISDDGYRSNYSKTSKRAPEFVIKQLVSTDKPGKIQKFKKSSTRKKSLNLGETDNEIKTKRYSSVYSPINNGAAVNSRSSSDTTITVAGLSLNNGIRYYFSIRANDRAGNTSMAVSSNGITVDTQSPVTGTVNDGDSVDVDWTNNTTTLTANWEGFSDALSGIQLYEYAIGTSIAGTETRNWTPVDTDTLVTAEGLNLNNGAAYYFSIRAIDNVSNVSAIAATNGITVDNILPTIDYVYEGAIQADEDYQNSDSVLVLAWSGTDDASGIAAYEYAIGTTAGASDVIDWTDNGAANDITVELTGWDEGDIYYAAIRAADIAGNQSTIAMGNGITPDLSSPEGNLVFDGLNIDLDFSDATNTLEASWNTFTDNLSGLQFYEYQIGTTPGGNEVIGWTSTGTDTFITTPGLILVDAQLYYRSVRAMDNVTNLSITYISDGIAIDHSPPLTGIVNDGIGDDQTWTKSDSSLTLSWSGFNDVTSGIKFYEYAFGYNPGTDNFFQWTVGTTDTFIVLDNLNLNHGSTFFGSVRATDFFSHTSTIVSSDGITIDIFEPTVGIPLDGGEVDLDYQADSTRLSIVWTGNDSRSIDYFLYSIGDSPGDTNIVHWTDAGTQASITISGLNLEHGKTYFANVMAYDEAGNMSQVATSDGITIDLSPPSLGNVIDGLDQDMNFTASQDLLSGSWNGFSDTTSGIQFYEYCFGTSPGLSDIKNWTNIGTNLNTTIDQLVLNHATDYFISVRVTDNVQNISDWVSSNGITADHFGPTGNWVIDGDSVDIDFSNNNTEYFGKWQSFTDTTSGLSHYQVALYDETDDIYYRNWQNNNLDTSFSFTNLELVEGHLYAVYVRGIDNVANIGSVITSDGVTIDMSAPAIPQNLTGYFSSNRIYLTWETNTESDLANYQVYAGITSEPDTVLLLTSENSIEVFSEGFQNDIRYYFRVSAKDISDNESNLSSVVSGIPQLAQITHSNPTELSRLSSTDNQLKFHFSQPLNDIGLTEIKSVVYPTLNFESEYDSSDTSILITINDVYPSLDTLDITLSGILDWAGNLAENKNLQYHTYALADYDNNRLIDFSDLTMFVTAWNSKDYEMELGPVTGTVPHLISNPDGIFNLDDIMSFTRMWNWSHQQEQPILLAARNTGVQPEINQEGRQVIITLPANASIGQINLAYMTSSTKLTFSGINSNSQKIVLGSNNEIKGDLLIEYAFLDSTINNQIMIDKRSLNNNNSEILLSYYLLDAKGDVVSEGVFNFELVAVPSQFALHQNYPNPFNPITAINYDLPENADVQLIIYDILGREIMKLVNESQTAGYKSIQWNGRNSSGMIVGAGMYLCRLQAGDYNKVMKMVMLK